MNELSQGFKELPLEEAYENLVKDYVLVRNNRDELLKQNMSFKAYQAHERSLAQEKYMGELVDLKQEIAEKDTCIADLQAQVDALRKDAGMWRSVSFSIEEAIRNGMCNYEIEDAYEAAISKGGE